jgi:hypothetical protein
LRAEGEAIQRTSAANPESQQALEQGGVRTRLTASVARNAGLAPGPAALEEWAMALARRRHLPLAAAALLLSACEIYRPASPEEIARARYAGGDPPSVTLLSTVKTSSDRSGHGALLINGSQQVLYDPAGAFTHPDLPRAGDIHYGMAPMYVSYYELYHARVGHVVVAQTVAVDLATADRLITSAQVQGRALKTQCAITLAHVLAPVAPFDGVRGSFFPQALREDFALIPGVETRTVTDTDIGKNNEWERGEAAQVHPDMR